MIATSANAFQSAWVVDDIESTALRWAQLCGIGPFFITEYGEGAFEETLYRGQPAPITAKVAIAQAGDMQIELIQPTGNTQNVYRDTVPPGSNALHHIAIWCDELNSGIEPYLKQGFEIGAQGKVAGVGFAYIDTSAVLGHMVELVEERDIVKGIFAQVSSAATNWDGSDPIRTFA